MSVLPIVTYDDPVLRQKAAEIESDSEELQTLIDDMFETMYNGQGVGLAAPQIGESLRLFVTDVDPMYESEKPDKFGKMVFINPEITDSADKEVAFEEGCLSIPGIREQVKRPDQIKVKYLDRELKPQEAEFDGWMSRVFQHELDHLNGVLFIDYLGSFRRRLLKSKLNMVKDGRMEADYPLLEKVGRD